MTSAGRARGTRLQRASGSQSAFRLLKVHSCASVPSTPATQCPRRRCSCGVCEANSQAFWGLSGPKTPSWLCSVKHISRARKRAPNAETTAKRADDWLCSVKHIFRAPERAPNAETTARRADSWLCSVKHIFRGRERARNAETTTRRTGERNGAARKAGRAVSRRPAAPCDHVSAFPTSGSVALCRMLPLSYRSSLTPDP